jgi:cbb3-type cytochrome oxidase maturation protein
MEIIVLLICISILIALGFLWAFIWSIRNGQYDDNYTPGIRILFEDSNQTSDKQPKA